MTFEIESPAKAKVLDVEVLSQKNRPEGANPGLKLPLALKLSNHMLAGFDGALKSFLFTKTAATQPVATRREDNSTETLDGVEPVSDLPNLTKLGEKIGAFTWHEEITGLAVEIIFATGKLDLDDCTATGFRIAGQEGGTVLLNMVIEAPDAKASDFAKLAMFKSREVEITMLQHEPAQQEIDPPQERPGRKAKAEAPPKTDATAEFIARNQAAGAH